MDKNNVMEKWDIIREYIRNGDSGSRDIFESIIDGYEEEKETIKAENARLRQLIKDTVDGMECLETCNTYGHDERCPIAYPEYAWRILQEEKAELIKILEEIKEYFNTHPAEHITQVYNLVCYILDKINERR